jgi:branched-chain amino acid transport system substrate-binding protein
MTNVEGTMSRSRFVKVAAAGGLVAAAPLASAHGARAASTIALKVGVMVPTGASYGSMGRSLVDGLRHGFGDSPAVDVTLVTRDVARGYDGAEGVARRLLDEGSDVVVAGVSAPVAARLGGLFAERQASLVVADVGGHVVQAAPRNPFVLHNSLLYWQASFAMGRWAAANVGPRAVVASSLCDSGYDTVYAFRRGFESAGGTLVGDAVTHVDPADDGLSDLFTTVRSAGPNVVYGLYSGAQAVEFVAAYAASGVSAKLVVGSLAAEDYLLSSIGRAAVGATSCASWTATRNTKANQSFGKAFRTRTGRRADPFAALGYDTGALVAEGVRRATKQGLGVRRLIEALAGVSTEGPRGRLVVDAATNTVKGPLFVREVRRGLVNYDLARAPAVETSPDALSLLETSPRSGYVNEYLCA